MLFAKYIKGLRQCPLELISHCQSGVNFANSHGFIALIFNSEGIFQWGINVTGARPGGAVLVLGLRKIAFCEVGGFFSSE